MKVNVICWDGVKYQRTTSKEEVEEMKNQGFCKVDKDRNITFDFGNGKFGDYTTKSSFIG